MSPGPFDERPSRPRVRQPVEETATGSAGSGVPVDIGEPAGRPVAAARLPAEALRDLRAGVRATLDEWLTGRSNTASMAVAQLVEDTLRRMQQEHAATIEALHTEHQARIESLERDHAEALRASGRRRRARMRAIERDLRDRIEQLERSLTQESIEGVERLRQVERKAADSRADLETCLRERDEEIARLRRQASGASDQLYDTLHDQLRGRTENRDGSH